MARRLTAIEYEKIFEYLRCDSLLRNYLSVASDTRCARTAVRETAESHGFSIPAIIDRHSLLVHLCHEWGVSIEPHPDDASADWMPTFQKEVTTPKPPAHYDLDDAVAYVCVFKSTQGTTMNNDTTITIETRTFINGRDARQFSDSEIYGLISGQEAKINELNTITNKPQRLVDEVAKRQAGIDALVAYLNDKDADKSGATT